MEKFNYLLPYPQKVEEREGTYVFNNCHKAFISKGAFQDKAVINKLLELEIGFDCTDQIPGYKVVIINENALDSHRDISLANALDKPLEIISNKAEGYILLISDFGVSIEGYDIEGLFRGLTTFEQIYSNAKVKALPFCQITDWPEVAVRGHFDDVSRKRISTTEDFKNIIRRLSSLKINYYGLYIEDILHLKAYPDIGEKRGKLMPWDIEELLVVAELYKVNIVPFFQLVGHSENILEMPNYSYLGRKVIQKMSSLDPSNPEVRVFLKNCIEEVAELFPCKYFGMGFDETQGLAQGDFFSHANWCAMELEKYSKTPLLWADMIYNHYGINTINQLEESIIVIDWQYNSDDGEIPFWTEMLDTGRKTWGFGGYNNWCVFLPDFEKSKDNIDIWTRTVNKGAGSGLFYSQWGDDGYENNRDLSWDLFAYAGECSWRGNSERRFDFEERFQQQLFGRVISAIKEIVFATGDLNYKINFWALHRRNTNAMFRIATNSPELRPLFENAHEKITILRARLLSEQVDTGSTTGSTIIHHFNSALTTMLVITKRMLFAFKYSDIINGGGNIFDSENQKDLIEIINEITFSRDLYMKDWLLTNKLEGLEVSVDVYNSVISSYQKLLRRSVEPREGFQVVKLDNFYNTFLSDIAGIPIGCEVCAGVPFSFADCKMTHVLLNKDDEIIIDIDHLNQSNQSNRTKIKDLHLIVSSPMTEGAVPLPAMKVSLMKDGAVIACEVVNSVTHCVDWWAPMGEHMWAGGGYAYADKTRVTLALKPDLNYGLMKLSGFKFGETDNLANFDQIRITAFCEKELAIFALTLQI